MASIRRTGDLDLIRELNKTYFDAELPDKSYLGSVWWLATDGEDTIGFIGLDYRHGEAHMSRIAVHPKYRGRGLARRLTRALVRYWLEHMPERPLQTYTHGTNEPSNRNLIRNAGMHPYRAEGGWVYWIRPSPRP